MGQKVSFNALTKIITVTQTPDADDTITISVKKDLYSDGKEDWVASESLRKYQFPITAIGGNLRPDGSAVGATFFIDSAWKIQPYSANHKMVVQGNLYAVDGTDPFLNADGYTIRIVQDISTIIVRIPQEVPALSTEESSKLMGLPDETVTDQDKSDIAMGVWQTSDAGMILKILKNKRAVQKIGSEWRLVVYDNDGETPVLDKALKDKNGSNITDPAAGSIAQELASIV